MCRAQACPAVPAAFLAQVLPQVAAAPWSAYGPRVACSQLHGPRTILLGDAAHSISPRIGGAKLWRWPVFA